MPRLLLLLGVTLLLTSDLSSGDHSSDVRCLSCEDVTSPDQCLTSEQCALDEICFAREIFDHQGRHAFRLGCESKAVCDLAAITHVVGRRGARGAGSQVTGPASAAARNATSCFQCCASDHCNSDLCSDVVGVNRTDQGSHLGAPSHCPPGFVKGPNSCLYFSTVQVYWSTARKACEGMNASLVKIGSRDKDLWLLAKLRQLKTPASSYGYWVGGYRDKHADTLRWLDGSQVRYTRWALQEPNPAYTALLLANPATLASRAPNWEWMCTYQYYTCGYICEMH